MSLPEPVLDDDTLDSTWAALGWIVLAAMVSVAAFLLSPL